LLIVAFVRTVSNYVQHGKGVDNVNVLIGVETCFYMTPNGEVWTSGQNDYTFWQRYLPFFDNVLVIARVKQVSKKSDNWIRANGHKVDFICLPAYKGPWEYWMMKSKLTRIIKKSVLDVNLVILRGPGAIATLLWHELKRQGKNINMEVCGDPWESLAPGTIKSIARPFARVTGYLNLKKQCKEANAITYVTQNALQNRYPANRHALALPISDVSLPKEAFYKRDIKKTLNSIKRKQFRILHAGSMETLYKAQDIQIKAIKQLVEQGYDVRLDFAGEGQNKKYYESLTKELDLECNIGFLGMLPGPEALREELLKSDLFILPSFVEGLPRALVEAMAMGLPCIATNVGGIPELLPVEDLVDPKSEFKLASKIIEVITDRNRMEEMSERNYKKAQEYSEGTLTEKRARFYNYIINR
jgi:glycosyltransferase involved in cell wall biosynthesis